MHIGDRNASQQVLSRLSQDINHLIEKKHCKVTDLFLITLFGKVRLVEKRSLLGRTLAFLNPILKIFHRSPLDIDQAVDLTRLAPEPPSHILDVVTKVAEYVHHKRNPQESVSIDTLLSFLQKKQKKILEQVLGKETTENRKKILFSIANGDNASLKILLEKHLENNPSQIKEITKEMQIFLQKDEEPLHEVHFKEAIRPLVLIFGDTFIKESEWEGWYGITFARLLETFFCTYPHTLPQQTSLSTLFKNIIDLKSEDPHQLEDKVRKLLNENQRVLFIAGWKSHAVILEIVQEGKKYIFRIHNSGEGIGRYHTTMRVAERLKFSTSVGRKDIDEKVLFNGLFFPALQKFASDLTRESGYYDSLPKGSDQRSTFLYEQLFDSLGGSAEENLPFARRQLAGTCAYRSFHHFLLASLGKNDYGKFKAHFHLYLLGKLERILDRECEILKHQEDASGAFDPQITGAINVLKMIMRKVSTSWLKTEQYAPHLTSSHFSARYLHHISECSKKIASLEHLVDLKIMAWTGSIEEKITENQQINVPSSVTVKPSFGHERVAVLPPRLLSWQMIMTKSFQELTFQRSRPSGTTLFNSILEEMQNQTKRRGFPSDLPIWNNLASLDSLKPAPSSALQLSYSSLCTLINSLMLTNLSTLLPDDLANNRYLLWLFLQYSTEEVFRKLPIETRMIDDLPSVFDGNAHLELLDAVHTLDPTWCMLRSQIQAYAEDRKSRSKLVSNWKNFNIHCSALVQEAVLKAWNAPSYAEHRQAIERQVTEEFQAQQIAIENEKQRLQTILLNLKFSSNEQQDALRQKIIAVDLKERSKDEYWPIAFADSVRQGICDKKAFTAFLLCKNNDVYFLKHRIPPLPIGDLIAHIMRVAHGQHPLEKESESMSFQYVLPGPLLYEQINESPGYKITYSCSNKHSIKIKHSSQSEPIGISPLKKHLNALNRSIFRLAQRDETRIPSTLYMEGDALIKRSLGSLMTQVPSAPYMESEVFAKRSLGSLMTQEMPEAITLLNFFKGNEIGFKQPASVAFFHRLFFHHDSFYQALRVSKNQPYLKRNLYNFFFNAIQSALLLNSYQEAGHLFCISSVINHWHYHATKEPLFTIHEVVAWCKKFSQIPHDASCNFKEIYATLMMTYGQWREVYGSNETLLSHFIAFLICSCQQISALTREDEFFYLMNQYSSSMYQEDIHLLTKNASQSTVEAIWRPIVEQQLPFLKNFIHDPSQPSRYLQQQESFEIVTGRLSKGLLDAVSMSDIPLPNTLVSLFCDQIPLYPSPKEMEHLRCSAYQMGGKSCFTIRDEAKGWQVEIDGNQQAWITAPFTGHQWRQLLSVETISSFLHHFFVIDGHQSIRGIHHQTLECTYRIENDLLIERATDYTFGMLPASKNFQSLSRFEDQKHTQAWYHRDGRLMRIDFPRHELSFQRTTTSQSNHFVWTNDPTWILAPVQYVQGMEGAGKIVLEKKDNPLSRQVILPSIFSSTTQAEKQLTHYFYTMEQGGCSIDVKQELSCARRYYLAYKLLSLGRIDEAEELLFAHEATILYRSLTEKEQAPLVGICLDPPKAPAALRVCLRAAYLLVLGNPSRDDTKKTIAKIFKIYQYQRPELRSYALYEWNFLSNYLSDFLMDIEGSAFQVQRTRHRLTSQNFSEDAVPISRSPIPDQLPQNIQEAVWNSHRGDNLELFNYWEGKVLSWMHKTPIEELQKTPFLSASHYILMNASNPRLVEVAKKALDILYMLTPPPWF